MRKIKKTTIVAVCFLTMFLFSNVYANVQKYLETTVSWNYVMATKLVCGNKKVNQRKFDFKKGD